MRILAKPQKADFTFSKDIKVDTANAGFSAVEIQRLASQEEKAAVQGARGGEKGLADWWTAVWGQGRSVPPEIENLKSEFGYQSVPILTDLIEVANFQGTPLDGIIKARSARYNFYILSCGVYISPQDNEKFEALKFEIYYKANNVATYSMLPGPQTEKLLAIGGKAEIGVTGKIDFGLPPIPIHGATVEAGAKAALEAKFIVAFDYELKTQVVDSFGVGNPFCRWFMYKGDNLRNDVVFYPIIMTPKNVTSFDCEFRAYFKISHPKWERSELFLKPPKTIPVSV
jgi:hypothetical protein